MVAIKIDTPSGAASNTDSCKDMARYLEKEDLEKALEKEFFFNPSKDKITTLEVIQTIDNNRQGLGKDDAKWFSGSINLSEEELKHINNDPQKLKEFGLEFFKLYAENFKRDVSVNDLNFFLKLETNRYYKGNSPEVKAGIAKQGEIKPGLNMHLHYIVGRKSVDGKKKLSPKTNHQKTEKGPITASFNRDELIEKTEQLFDHMFQYARPIESTYQNFKNMKNGNLNQRIHSLENKADTELYQKIFMASPLEKQQKFLIEKIEQINYQLERIKSAPLDSAKILSSNLAVRNGSSYFNLLNLEQLIQQKGAGIGNANELIFQSISNGEKSLNEQSVHNRINSVNTITHIFNSELPSVFALNTKDIILDINKIDNNLLGSLIHALKRENRLIISPFFVNQNNSNALLQTKIAPSRISLVAEINDNFEKMGYSPEIRLTLDFIERIKPCFPEQKINSALLSMNGIIKTNHDSHTIKNLNLFLVSVLIHSEKKYSEMPKALRKEGVRKYSNYLNSKLVGNTELRINTKDVLRVEQENDFSGTIFKYLNSIHGKIKREDYLGAEKIIQQNPRDFIEQNMNPTYSYGTEINIPFDTNQIGSADVHENPDNIMDLDSGFGSIMPHIAPIHQASDFDEEEWLRRKKKKQQREQNPDKGMSM